MNWNDIRKLELVVYSTTWCSDCTRLKMVLDEKQVNYTEIDIDKDPTAAKALQEGTGRSAIPFIRINGGPFIRGWHQGKPGAWDENIFFNEVNEAL